MADACIEEAEQPDCKAEGCVCCSAACACSAWPLVEKEHVQSF